VLAIGVKAGIGQDQSLHWLSTYDVGFDNLIHIGRRDSAIPDRVRVHDQIRTMLALIQTAGLVGAYLPLEPPRCQLFLEQFLSNLGIE
jgi:hypothetical protein